MKSNDVSARQRLQQWIDLVPSNLYISGPQKEFGILNMMSRTGIMSIVSCQKFQKPVCGRFTELMWQWKMWTHAGIIGTQSQARLCTRHARKLYFKIFCM